MSSNNEETTIEIAITNNESSQMDEEQIVKKKFTFKDFIRFSGVTLTFMAISLVLIVVGIIVFSLTKETNISTSVSTCLSDPTIYKY
ncbi:MAG: hypothetical protein ACFFDW_10390, partial [Candidatus Thorarchaeota archaeon]